MTTATFGTEAIESNLASAGRAAICAARVVAGAVRHMIERRYRWRIEAQLHAMSDHQLRDVGIRRTGIGFIAGRSVHRR